MASQPSARGRARRDLVVFLSWLVLILVALPAPPTIYSDQALTLKPLLQYLAGESRSINHLVTASPANLHERVTTWIIEWPPSTQLLAWPLLSAGASLGTAIRTLAVVSVLVASLGWLRWWQLFELPPRLLVVAAVLMPWRRLTSNAIFQSSSEVLALAAIPWVLLAAHALTTREQDQPVRTRAWLTGLGAGALYCVKYSAVFVSAAVSGILLLRHWRDRAAWTRVLLPAFIGCAIPIVSLSLLNRTLGGSMNFMTSDSAGAFSPWLILRAIANPALIAADATSLLEYVLTNQDYGVWRQPLAIVAIGVPGGLTLAWLATKASRVPERMAVVTLAVTVGLLFIAWLMSPRGLYEPRHMSGASTAMLPAAIAIAARHWRAVRPLARAWFIVAAIVYVVLPWGVWGPVSVAAKVRRSAGYPPTALGLYNPLVSETDPRRALDGLKAACGPPPAVWYVPEPLTALEIQDPVLITHADFEPLEWLTGARFEGRITICALLPPRFEANGKGPAIRRSFLDVAHWTRAEVPGSAYDLWVGVPGP